MDIFFCGGCELKLLKILIIFLTVFFELISSLSGLENLRSEHQDPAKFKFKPGWKHAYKTIMHFLAVKINILISPYYYASIRGSLSWFSKLDSATNCKLQTEVILCNIHGNVKQFTGNCLIPLDLWENYKCYFYFKKLLGGE